ncbi:MAG: helix-turn-helix domain-containing protein [Clostridia bacterium]|nr:helix-turn-helix domain-containing protein [Clostridia bacterium]
MNLSYVSPFDVRQVMQQDDFEIFHRFDTAPGFITPHSHDFYEIFFPRTEGVTYIIDGHRYRLSPGMLVLIAPGQVHHSEVAEPGLVVERFVLWLNTSFVESLAGLLPRFRNLSPEDLKGRNLIVPDQETYELMIGLLFSLLHEKQLNDMDSASLNRLVVAQLLIHISRVRSSAPSGMSGRNAQRYKEIMGVYEYISTHLKDPLSVSELAEQFFMDKNTLTRQFKHVTGMTPAECIRRKRLDAAYMMISHGAGITESCHECGFTDYSAFYRAFRQVYGISPSDCAAQAQSGVKLEQLE